MDNLNCKICYLPFDNHIIIPRLLKCGHTFCQVCIKKCLKNQNIRCFLCRKETEAQNIDEIAKNFQLLDIISQNQSQIQEQLPNQSEQPQKSDKPYNQDKKIIYISNISPAVTQQQLTQIISKYTPIHYLKLTLNSKINLQSATIKTIKPEQKQIIWKFLEQDQQIQKIFSKSPYIVYAKPKNEQKKPFPYHQKQQYQQQNQPQQPLQQQNRDQINQIPIPQQQQQQQQQLPQQQQQQQQQYQQQQLPQQQQSQLPQQQQLQQQQQQQQLPQQNPNHHYQQQIPGQNREGEPIQQLGSRTYQNIELIKADWDNFIQQDLSTQISILSKILYYKLKEMISTLLIDEGLFHKIQIILVQKYLNSLTNYISILESPAVFQKTIMHIWYDIQWEQ